MPRESPPVSQGLEILDERLSIRSGEARGRPHLALGIRHDFFERLIAPIVKVRRREADEAERGGIEPRVDRVCIERVPCRRPPVRGVERMRLPIDTHAVDMTRSAACGAPHLRATRDLLGVAGLARRGFHLFEIRSELGGGPPTRPRPPPPPGTAPP